MWNLYSLRTLPVLKMKKNYTQIDREYLHLRVYVYDISAWISTYLITLLLAVYNGKKAMKKVYSIFTSYITGYSSTYPTLRIT